MKACGTCQYWVPPEDDLDKGYGRCREIPDGDHSSIVYTWDYEGYSSGISTKAEFGCVLHRERSDS